MQTLQNKFICIVTGQTRKPRPTEIIPHEKTVSLSQRKFTHRSYPSRFHAAGQSGDTLALQSGRHNQVVQSQKNSKGDFCCIRAQVFPFYSYKNKYPNDIHRNRFGFNRANNEPVSGCFGALSGGKTAQFAERFTTSQLTARGQLS